MANFADTFNYLTVEELEDALTASTDAAEIAWLTARIPVAQEEEASAQRQSDFESGYSEPMEWTDYVQDVLMA